MDGGIISDIKVNIKSWMDNTLRETQEEAPQVEVRLTGSGQTFYYK
jgi:hypothetical protein